MSVTISLNGKATIELTVNDSPIIIEVDGDNAPITAGNYVDLVDRDVYDGLAFHRVVKEPEPFVVQGGDPQGKDPDFPVQDMGTGGFVDPITGERRNIPLEIKPEGADEPLYNELLPEDVSPELKHTRGAVAMARSQALDTASSQFYFALDNLDFLDGNYAVFGYVLEGMDVVDQIVQGDRIQTAEVTSSIDSMTITSDNQDDVLSGTSFNDAIDGNGGDDTILGNDGNDSINGGVGDDSINGGDRRDNITGGRGNDTLDGGLGDDNMRGSDGDDLYIVDSEGDSTRKEKSDGGLDGIQASLSWTLPKNIEILLLNGEDNFTGTGNNFDNEIYGNAGRNRILGRDGDDLLFGGDGGDRLFGAEGDDTLVGGMGDDQLTGDIGRDAFGFNSSTEGTDSIIDFNVDDDLIVISADGFEGITTDNFSEEQFHLGTGAETDQHRLIYNSSSGTLLYDADGIGEIAPVEIAILDDSPSLTFGNIMVI